MGQNFDQAKHDDTFWSMPNILMASVNSIVKKIGRFFQKFGAFLEYLNFRPKNWHDSQQKKDEVVGKRVGKTYPH